MSSYVHASVSDIEGKSFAGEKEVSLDLTTFVKNLDGGRQIVADSSVHLTLEEAKELIAKLEEVTLAKVS